uniref:Uncharacterized protein n=1 Tax=Rhizophora mucronata TaxID=61149 RepID=A0A2P2NN02_RHIMU
MCQEVLANVCLLMPVVVNLKYCEHCPVLCGVKSTGCMLIGCLYTNMITFFFFLRKYTDVITCLAEV